MTLVNIDLRNQGYETGPDDRVVFYSLLVREGEFGTISTAPVTVRLEDGQATVDLAPGPVGVQIIAGQVADTRVKIGEVPPSGPTTLSAVMMVTPAYTPALQQMMIAAVERAKELALGEVDAEVAKAVDGEIDEFRTATDTALTIARDADAKSTSASGTATSALSKSTEAELLVSNVSTRMEGIESMAGIGPSTPADGQTANLLEQSATLTRKAADKATVLMSPHVDARAYGLWDITSASQDASDVLNAAAAAARAQGRPLYIPAPKNIITAFDGTSAYSIYKTVDLRYLDVYCDANIVLRHTDGVGVLVGDDANLRKGRTITLGNVKHHGMGHFSWDWEHAAVRILGLKGGYVKIPNASLIELYAETGTANGSVAYNTFAFQRVNHLRISCSGSGWVNENVFMGGSYNRITLGSSGSQHPNSNVWYKPSLEGTDAMVDIQSGYTNVFVLARNEDGTRVRFGATTGYNSLTSLFRTNPSVILNTFHVVEDLGRENIVASQATKEHTPYNVLTLSAETIVTNVASGVSGVRGIRPALPRGRIILPAGYDTWVDTGLLSLESLHAPRGGTVIPAMTPPSRVTRFSLHCDKIAVRWSVFLYDSARRLISSQATTSIDMYAGWSKGADGSYTMQTATAGLPLLIIDRSVKYARFVANSPLLAEDVRAVDSVSIVAYLPVGHMPTVIDRMRASVARPLYSATAPTQGLVWPGTVIQGPTGGWKSTFRLTTSLVDAAGGGVLVLQDATGVLPGDVIGVEQDDATTHWATVSAVSGTEVTISTAPAKPVAAGAQVGVVRWEVRA